MSKYEEAIKACTVENPVIYFDTPSWTYCDKQMPPANTSLVLLVAELDHYECPDDSSAHWSLYTDFGEYRPNNDGFYGLWNTDNDWDEGQPWAVVAWAPMPSYEGKLDEVKQHKISWFNLKSGPEIHG